MGWHLVVGFNGVIAVCYLAIAGLIVLGLARTRQLRGNALAVATASIFLSCAVHHGHHAAHLAFAFGHSPDELHATRHAFGEWHSVAIDATGAVVAVVYLRLRRSYRTLLNTPAMFDDAVRNETERQLRARALTDPVTGAPNRTAYQQLADDLPRDDGWLTALFLDLDGFKQVNDTHGHSTGDRVLRDVAELLTHALAPGEHVFRMGGDEFVVVAPADAVGAAGLEERVRAALAESLPSRAGALRVGASTGSATGRRSEGLDRLVREADVRMYEAKQQSRQPAQASAAPRSKAAAVPGSAPRPTAIPSR